MKIRNKPSGSQGEAMEEVAVAGLKTAAKNVVLMFNLLNF